MKAAGGWTQRPDEGGPTRCAILDLPEGAARVACGPPTCYDASMQWNDRDVGLEAAEWMPPNGVSGPPVVLLHEGLGSVALWKSFPRDLAAHGGRRVVAYSRRGHGRSDPLASPRAVDFMHEEAEVLRRLLVAHRLTDAVLFGHSDGASIALLYASRYPTAGVIALAPHVFVEPVSVESIRQANLRFESTDLAQRLALYHADPQHTFFAWHDVWMHPDFRAWNIEAETARIQAPLLVIQGRDDAYGTGAQYEAIARAAPQTDVLVLGRCGHSPHRDRLPEVLDATRTFIDTVTDPVSPR